MKIQTIFGLFWRLFYIDESNKSTPTNRISLIVTTDFIHYFKRGYSIVL